jgi:hypothetical protein
MIKTINANVVTPQMCKPLGFYNEHSIGWVRAILEAAPDVKSEPIGTLILGGIAGNEYNEIELDLKSKALKSLQKNLVTSNSPVVLEVYAHPPAASNGWIRAIDEALVCYHLDVANADDNYEVAKDKLNKLLCINQDIHHYFKKNDVIKRIRALEIAEPMGWMDRCHNTVVAKIVELIEVAKCTTQND